MVVNDPVQDELEATLGRQMPPAAFRLPVYEAPKGLQAASITSWGFVPLSKTTDARSCFGQE
jgi:hypothetical protein